MDTSPSLAIGRHAAPAHICEQVSEQLIGEQREALPVQHRVNRVRRDPGLAVTDRRAQQVPLFRYQTQRYRETPSQTTKPSLSFSQGVHLITALQLCA